MLIRSVADSRNRYLWKIWPYSGQPEAPEESPPTVTLESVPTLVHYRVDDVKGSGRNVTMER